MKKPLIILAFISITIVANAQIITTIAGNGSTIYGGDGGPAVLAGINYPTHTAMDNSGNLYFGDFAHNRIRKINPSGTITTIAGNGIPAFSGDGGQATAASIQGIAGIAIDSFGNIYFADYLNRRVRKISSSGIITTLAGTGAVGFGGDGGPSTAALITTPWGVAVDSFGNVYFSDRYNNRIREINIGGIISTIAGTGPTGFTGDGGPAIGAEINQPVDIALDRFGNLYFSDFINNRIRKINSVGIISTIAGNGIAGYSGDGIPATTSALNNPVGVGLDTKGNVYVGDYYNNRVRKIDISGIITTIAGDGIAAFSGDGGPATAARLTTPYGVAVYGAGDIYICDAFNYRIRVIAAGNHPPYFAGGHSQSLNVCQIESVAPVSINSLLAINDADLGQTETWSLSIPPSHGTVLASYTTTAIGGLLTPVGLTYTPVVGYIGTDLFQVVVSDGIATDTTTINVTVQITPDAGTISGIDSICPDDTTSLTETATGGIWSSSNSSISAINSSGIVTGIAPGNDTIIYTIIYTCGIVSTIFPFTVGSYSDCRTEIETLSHENSVSMKIYPNPAHNNLIIELPGYNNGNIQLINELAQIVLQKNISGNKVDLYLEKQLHPGLYFLRIQLEDQVIYKRLLKH